MIAPGNEIVFIIVLFATTWLVFLFTWTFCILILVFECLSVENRLTYCIFVRHISQPYIKIFITATNLFNQLNNISCQMVLVVKSAHPRHLEWYIDMVWYSGYKYWFELKLGNTTWLALVFVGYDRLTSAGTYLLPIKFKSALLQTQWLSFPEYWSIATRVWNSYQFIRPIVSEFV